MRSPFPDENWVFQSVAAARAVGFGRAGRIGRARGRNSFVSQSLGLLNDCAFAPAHESGLPLGPACLFSSLYEARVVKGLSGGMDLAVVIVCLAERGAKGL